MRANISLADFTLEVSQPETSIPSSFRVRNLDTGQPLRNTPPATPASTNGEHFASGLHSRGIPTGDIDTLELPCQKS